MSIEEFEKLLVDYGNCSFDCGEAAAGDDLPSNYQELAAASKRAKQRVMDAFIKVRLISIQSSEK